MAEAAAEDEAVLEGAPAAEPVLLRSNAEGVVGLTLNRPDQYNALCAAPGKAADGARSDQG